MTRAKTFPQPTENSRAPSETQVVSRETFASTADFLLESRKTSFRMLHPCFRMQSCTLNLPSFHVERWSTDFVDRPLLLRALQANRKPTKHREMDPARVQANEEDHAPSVPRGTVGTV